MKVILLLIFAISCNYKILKDDFATEVTVPGDMVETVSFKQVNEEVFSAKCIACHGNAAGVNLESHASAHKHLDAIRKATLEAKTMPKAPFGALNDRQYQVITAWIDAGGPDKPIGHGGESGGSSGDPDDTESGDDDFQSIKKSIISKQCLVCHTSGGEAGNILFDTKEQMLSSSLKLIVPGKPEESLFYTITAPGAMNMMPPYPMKPLSKKQRKMIEQWILGGAN